MDKKIEDKAREVMKTLQRINKVNIEAKKAQDILIKQAVDGIKEITSEGLKVDGLPPWLQDAVKSGVLPFDFVSVYVEKALMITQTFTIKGKKK